MADLVAGLAEMARVTRPAGVVAASVWDHAGGDRAPLSMFSRAIRDLDPEANDEPNFPGHREGHLAALFESAGLHEVESWELTVRVDYSTFDDWWEPYTMGVGPAGAYVASLDPEDVDHLRAHCAELLPEARFTVEATAWTALGVA